MNKKSLTITAILIGIIGYLANLANVILSPEEIETFLNVVIKLGTVAGWIIVWIKRLARGDVKLFGGRKFDRNR